MSATHVQDTIGSRSHDRGRANPGTLARTSSLQRTQRLKGSTISHLHAVSAALSAALVLRLQVLANRVSKVEERLAVQRMEWLAERRERPTRNGGEQGAGRGSCGSPMRT